MIISASPIDGALRDRLQVLTVSDGIAAGEITFDDAFPGFDGHFTGNPVVPGVCLLQAMRILCEVSVKKSLEVSLISGCRFRSPVLPGMKIRLEAHIAASDTGYEVVGKIDSGDISVCKMKMKLL